MARFFYKPRLAWAADFIPLWAEGAFQLYYLHDWRNVEDAGEGVPWYLVRTDDFTRFEELGEALPRGGADEQDLNVFTGSAISAFGKYYIFYTGHNPGKSPAERILRAESDDLVHWTKRPDFALDAPEGYEPDDWRDPFVYRNERTGRYDMLLAARLDEGAESRRGVTARLSSADLETWTLEEPFYAPNAYYTHECPDYFAWNGWEYLLFSEFSADFATRYVMRRAGEETWCAPKDDRFDSRAFYAAKTASDGENRYLFGWIATRKDNSDEGAWQWGGCLNVHKLAQRKDGTLFCLEPQSVKQAFTRRVRMEADIFAIEADGMDAYCMGALPETCRIEMRIYWAKETREFGLVLRADDEGDKGHWLRIEPDAFRFSFDRQAGLSRPFAPARWHTLSLVLDGTALCAYLDDVALSARAYKAYGDKLHLYVRGGRVEVEDVKVFERA